LKSQSILLYIEVEIMQQYNMRV